jgi:hypothetical protein
MPPGDAAASLVERTLSDPEALIVDFRDRRSTLLLSMLGLLLIGFLLWSNRRQQFDCSRSSGLCTLQEGRLRGPAWRREIALASVVSVNFYKTEVGEGRVRQGLELRTLSERIQWAASEPCAPGPVPCPGDQAAALTAIHTFLKNDTLPSVHAEYGSEDRNIRTAYALLAGFLAFSLLGWQRVRGTASSLTRRLVVSKRLALFRARHRDFPLDTVREALFTATQMGSSRSYAVRLVTDEGGFDLARAPSHAAAAQRFVDDLNRVLRTLRGTPGPRQREVEQVALAAPPVALLLRDPIVVTSHYRGWTGAVLVLAAVINALVLLADERQELHCSRRSATCRLETHKLLGTSARTLPLASVTGVALYKLEEGRSSRQGLELLTDAAPAALPASEGCRYADLTRFCAGSSEDSYHATQVFLADLRQQDLHTGYGKIGRDLPVLDTILGLFLLASLLQWESFGIMISPSNGSVSVVRRRALLFTRWFELDLNEVREASFDAKRDHAEGQLLQRAQLLSQKVNASGSIAPGLSRVSSYVVSLRNSTPRWWRLELAQAFEAFRRTLESPQRFGGAIYLAWR